MKSCEDGKYFCTTFEMCQDMFGQECAADVMGCCDDEETDSSPELSVQEDPDCEELCSGLEDDTNTGLCCASSFCWCTEIGNFLMLCQEGSQYCPEAAQCMDMSDQICQEIPWCCPAI